MLKVFTISVLLIFATSCGKDLLPEFKTEQEAIPKDLTYIEFDLFTFSDGSKGRYVKCISSDICASKSTVFCEGAFTYRYKNGDKSPDYEHTDKTSEGVYITCDTDIETQTSPVSSGECQEGQKWTADDGCNTCTCVENGLVICTVMACL